MTEKALLGLVLVVIGTVLVLRASDPTHLGISGGGIMLLGLGAALYGRYTEETI